ncbi:tripartite tricarboxylate transporter substrate-binding protein [Roseomonas sp. BN140053]|uniref:tripartite tricarboxylate transporter substrate-binding protein n=1 Tax=Roseomonas sp. BN140053 TaxID=3391898 RepID=UPI0039EB7EA1
MTRRAALAVAGLGLGRPFIGSAHAQEGWPARVNLLVGFAPGGFADSFARLLANRLTERLGRTVTVENRAGAGGNIAAGAAAAGPADGSVLLVTTTALAVNPALYAGRLGYAMDQLLPVAIPAALPELLATHPSRPSANLAEYLDWARKQPEITLASGGVGTGSHITAEYFFRQLAGVRAIHVPYRGGAPAVQAAMNGEVDAVGSSLQGVSQVQTGALRGLAVASAARNPLLPDVPTYEEAGFPDFQASSWVGVFQPARAGKALAARLSVEVNAAMTDPALAEPLRRQGHDITLRDFEATRAFLDAELDRWGSMVRTIGATAAD